MTDGLYGVDPAGEVTPMMVRDAMVTCFYEAHCDDAGFSEKMPVGYCEELVRKAFKDTGGDYEQPTKEAIMLALGGLAEFSSNFRTNDVIQKHYNQMLTLANRLK